MHNTSCWDVRRSLNFEFCDIIKLHIYHNFGSETIVKIGKSMRIYAPCLTSTQATTVFTNLTLAIIWFESQPIQSASLTAGLTFNPFDAHQRSCDCIHLEYGLFSFHSMGSLWLNLDASFVFHFFGNFNAYIISVHTVLSWRSIPKKKLSSFYHQDGTHYLYYRPVFPPALSKLSLNPAFKAKRLPHRFNARNFYFRLMKEKVTVGAEHQFKPIK